jgi:hypothetical protein
MCLTFFASNGKQDVPLGWVNKPIADCDGRIKGGVHILTLWDSRQKAQPTMPCEQNPNSSLSIKIQFEDVTDPIVFIDPVVPSSTQSDNTNTSNVPNSVIEEILQKGFNLPQIKTKKKY